MIPDKFREVQWTSCPDGMVSPEFVARVARLLVADSQATSAAGKSAPAIPATAPPRGRIWGRRAIIVGILAAALVAVGVLGVYKKAFQSKTISMVAVLPFENATGDPANEYLGNGISESLINKLSGLSDLHVVSRTSAFALKGKAMEPIEIGAGSWASMLSFSATSPCTPEARRIAGLSSEEIRRPGDLCRYLREPR